MLNASQLNTLKTKLKGTVVILGIGNTLKCDDGAGAILASRLKGKVPFIVYDVSTGLENYLGKVIRDSPQTIVLIDAADIGCQAGGFKMLDGHEVKTNNLFFTHNASIALTIDYFQEHLKVDIVALLIQPKTIAFGDTLSAEVEQTITSLEQWFLEAGKG